MIWIPHGFAGTASDGSGMEPKVLVPQGFDGNMTIHNGDWGFIGLTGDDW